MNAMWEGLLIISCIGLVGYVAVPLMVFVLPKLGLLPPIKIKM